MSNVSLKTKEEIEILREGGKRHAEILRKLSAMVRPGVSAKELDAAAEQLIRANGDEPAFLGYRPSGAKFPFPASLCVSINDEVVHGIPTSDRILQNGDLVSLDCGIQHKGLITDSAITVPVGEISNDAKELLAVAEGALHAGILVAKNGNTVGDIGHAIESFIREHGAYGIVTELAGHGVGYKVHEAPYVPNVGKQGEGEALLPGMVIALEPMVTLGTQRVVLDPDGYTYRTKDKSLAAHFEHTIAITQEGPLVLTAL